MAHEGVRGERGERTNECERMSWGEEGEGGREREGARRTREAGSAHSFHPFEATVDAREWKRAQQANRVGTKHATGDTNSSGQSSARAHFLYTNMTTNSCVSARCVRGLFSRFSLAAGARERAALRKGKCKCNLHFMAFSRSFWSKSSMECGITLEPMRYPAM